MNNLQRDFYNTFGADYNVWNELMPLVVDKGICLSPAFDKPDTDWYADAIFSTNINHATTAKTPQEAAAMLLLAMHDMGDL